MAVKEGEMELRIRIGASILSLECHAKECNLQSAGEIYRRHLNRMIVVVMRAIHRVFPVLPTPTPVLELCFPAFEVRQDHINHSDHG